jgi:hypothetical protein
MSKTQRFTADRLSQTRARRRRGRRTKSAYSYSTQPPRPVGVLTLPAEVQEPGDHAVADRWALPAVIPAIELPDAFKPWAKLGTLPNESPLFVKARERLALQGPTLDDLLAGENPG